MSAEKSRTISINILCVYNILNIFVFIYMPYISYKILTWSSKISNDINIYLILFTIM